MYRTDKQFMKNPATAPQRIYIGALPKTVVAGDLEEKFGNHGKILGLSIQNGFAFIQFETDQQAQAAIKSENGSQLHGKRIVVKQAVDKSTKSNFPPQQQQQQNKFPGRNQYPNQGKPPMGDSPKNQKPESFPPANNDEPPPVTEVDRNDQSHSQDEMQTSQDDPKFSSMEEEALHFEPPASHFLERPPRYDEPPGRFSEPSSRFNEPPGRFNEMPPGRFNEPPGRFDDRRFDDRPPFDDAPGMRDGPRFDRGGRKGRGRGRGGGSGGGRDMREDRFPPPPHDQFRDKPPFFANRDEPVFVPSNFNPPPPILERPERNDCEIIVVAKALTEYAEYIEERLKQLGLIVDLLFPNEDVPIGKVLANISSRGCLFAILVMPQNEEHRSLTLNILHGVPQEHRNMPIEDALILITRNFENYMRGEPPTSDPPAGSKMNLTDRHPISVQMLLNLLAENRQINSVQYEKIIKYLQEKLELQVEYEKAEGIEMTSEGETTKQAELQNRILNILNKSGDGPASAPQPAPPKPASGVAPSPLLKDPTVQKALDSLMLGDMFKTMGAAS